MPYTQYTMASLVTEIARLNDDPDFIQWKYEETRYGVIEALRYWGALTGYWRERGTFNTTAGVPWYDLSVQIPNLRARVTTFNDLILEIDYHLFETPGGFAGTGLTSQFTISQIITSIARARNRFVLDTGLPLTVSSPQAVSAVTPDGRITTDESFVYLRHAYWKDEPSGAWSPLRQTDAWSQDAYSPLWTLDSGIPFSYSSSVTNPTDVQLFPIPANPGSIEWLTANSVDFSTAIASTLLQIPDEFVHAIKYAALSDLMTMDNESVDVQRAQYCDQRYQQIVTIARSHRSAVRVLVNNVPLPMSTLTSLDSALPRWRMSSGRPGNSGCDLDMLALAAVPNSSYGVSCDVLRSAPIPATDAEPIQIGRELIAQIIDYAQHYLSLKLGGVEFYGTMQTYDSFITAARSRNLTQAKQMRFLVPLFGMPGNENTQQMGEESTKEDN